MSDYWGSVREKFGDYRWIPLEPELMDYPNAQFLMIGEAQQELGKAAVAEPGDKRPEEIQPGEEVEKLEEENEERVEHLRGKCIENYATRDCALTICRR